MTPEATRPSKTQMVRLVLIIGVVTFLTITSIQAVTKLAAAAPDESTALDTLGAPALQATTTPTATLRFETRSTFSITLTTLGYEERILASPYDSVEYPFRIPTNWIIQPGAFLDLYLSYHFNQVRPDEYPTLFGDLTVKLDKETIEVFSIEEVELDNYQLRIPLPASLLNNRSRTLHTIELIFDTGFICEIPHRAKLVIYPNSSISYAYERGPIALELSRYPRPFDQQMLDTHSRVHFVLPSQPSSNNINYATTIAAKLGDLTNNQMVISTTTDVAVIDLLTDSPDTFDEHLIIIGQPQDNQLLLMLNDLEELPVSVHTRQLEITAQGPTAVAPGDIFSYIYTVTNSLDRIVELSLVDLVPMGTKLHECLPACTENIDSNTITWRANQVNPDEAISFNLSLEAADILTGSILENTVTLLESELGPVNADTLISEIVTDSSGSEVQISVPGANDYFFIYEGLAVATGDGIVQVIISPWSQERAILIITGLSDDALRKSSQAMSSETVFPGMSGTVALVQDALSLAEVDELSLVSEEQTFEDMGYEDRVMQGINAQEVDYWFNIPYGWDLTGEAGVDLYFSHSQLLAYEDSGMTVLLNNQPVASTAFSNETSGNGHIQFGLADVNIREGQTNRLTVQVDMSLPNENCAGPDNSQAWFVVKNNSGISLAHTEYGLNLDLDKYPYPFHINSALSNLLLVLPDSPTNEELDGIMRVAAALGNSAGGKTIIPMVIMAGDYLAQESSEYQVIALGRPNRNDLIRQLNDELPQPFLAGSNAIDQKLDDVVFRLPPDIALGYLQLIPAPWDEERALLVITGTTDESVNWAANVLAKQPWALDNGNLALVKGNQVQTIDTRPLTTEGVAVTVATAVPELVTEVAATVTPDALPTSTSVLEPAPANATARQAATEETERPAWLIPLIVVTGLTVIAIFAFALWQARRRASR